MNRIELKELHQNKDQEYSLNSKNASRKFSGMADFSYWNVALNEKSAETYDKFAVTIENRKIGKSKSDDCLDRNENSHKLSFERSGRRDRRLESEIFTSTESSTEASVSAPSASFPNRTKKSGNKMKAGPVDNRINEFKEENTLHCFCSLPEGDSELKTLVQCGLCALW